MKVSAEAHHEWTEFARRNGVTVAALLEVLGHRLDRAFKIAELDAVLTEARDLSHERRRAGGPSRPAGES